MWKSISKDKTSFKLRGETYTITHFNVDSTGEVKTQFSAGVDVYNVPTDTILELLYMNQKRSELEADIQLLEAQMYESLQKGFFKPELSKVYQERNNLKK